MGAPGFRTWGCFSQEPSMSSLHSGPLVSGDCNLIELLGPGVQHLGFDYRVFVVGF